MISLLTQRENVDLLNLGYVIHWNKSSPISLILKNQSLNKVLKSNNIINSLLSDWNHQYILKKFHIYAGYMAKCISLASYYHCA